MANSPKETLEIEQLELPLLKRLKEDRGQMPWKEVQKWWSDIDDEFRGNVTHCVTGSRNAPIDTKKRADIRSLLYILSSTSVEGLKKSEQLDNLFGRYQEASRMLSNISADIQNRQAIAEGIPEGAQTPRLLNEFRKYSERELYTHAKNIGEILRELEKEIRNALPQGANFTRDDINDAIYSWNRKALDSSRDAAILFNEVYNANFANRNDVSAELKQIPDSAEDFLKIITSILTVDADDTNAIGALLTNLVRALRKMQKLSVSSGGAVPYNQWLRDLLLIATNALAAKKNIGMDGATFQEIADDVDLFYTEVAKLRASGASKEVPQKGHLGYLPSYFYLLEQIKGERNILDVDSQVHAAARALVYAELGVYGPNLDPPEDTETEDLGKRLSAAFTTRKGLRGKIAGVGKELLGEAADAISEAGPEMKGAAKGLATLRQSASSIINSLPATKDLKWDASAEDITEQFGKVPGFGNVQIAQAIAFLGIQLEKRCSQIDHPKLSKFISTLQDILAYRVAEIIVCQKPESAWTRVSQTMLRTVHTPVLMTLQKPSETKSELDELKLPEKQVEEKKSSTWETLQKIGTWTQIAELLGWGRKR